MSGIAYGYAGNTLTSFLEKMTCCKCQEFGWDHPAEVVWKNREGQEYCVFHAPGKYKNTSQHDFNALVISFIKASSSRRELCNFCGAIFPWPIYFSLKEFPDGLVDVDFAHAIFLEDVCFSTIDITEQIDFSAAHFKKCLVFRKVKFFGLTAYTDVICDGLVSFELCEFHEVGYFNDSSFNSSVHFIRCAFKDDINFSGTKFGKKFTIEKSKLSKDIFFNNAYFNAGAEIVRAKFWGKASFKEAMFSGTTVFVSSVFFGDVQFEHASFYGQTRFTKCRVLASIEFNEIQVVGIVGFFLMDLSNSSFLLTQLDNISFQSVLWRKSIDGSRYALCIEEEICKHPCGTYDRHSNIEILRGVIEFYRQMKKKSREKLNDGEASLWHYAERETHLRMLREEGPITFQRVMLGTYRIISRYGEDPRQAAEVLLYLLLALLATLALGGLQSLGEPPYDITAARVANGFRAFAQYTLFIKPSWSPPGYFDVVAIFLSRLIIPIQATIFAFALRNKLHR